MKVDIHNTENCDVLMIRGKRVQDSVFRALRDTPEEINDETASDRIRQGVNHDSKSPEPYDTFTVELDDLDFLLDSLQAYAESPNRLHRLSPLYRLDVRLIGWLVGRIDARLEETYGTDLASESAPDAA